MSTYPPVPGIDEVARHFCRALRESRRLEEPYRHWKLKETLPVDICTGILTLPIAPATLGQTDGTRGNYNKHRCFITPDMRAMFPTCAVLSEALQRPEVARQMAETCDIEVAGGYLRMEYMQDTDGS